MKFPITHFLAKSIGSQTAVILICLAALTNLTVGQQRVSDLGGSKSSVTETSLAPQPFFFSGGNINCEELNDIVDTNPDFMGAFAHIIDDDELKLNFGVDNGPIDGTFQFRSYNAPGYPAPPPPDTNVILAGNVPQPAFRSIYVRTSGNNIAQFNSQVQITAVIVKVANDSYAFPYGNLTYSDTNLITRVANSIRHITFCYGVAIAPSAAPATVSGRVVSASGIGIYGSYVTMLDPSTGVSTTARSNGFGYYTLAAVPAGNLYVISITDKRHTFAEDTRTVTVNEDLYDLDFVANPLQ